MPGLYEPPPEPPAESAEPPPIAVNVEKTELVPSPPLFGPGKAGAVDPPVPPAPTVIA